MKKLFWVLILLGMLFVVGSGCGNMAAERLAEDLWIDHVDIILKSTILEQNDKELYIIEVMQANGFTDDEIADYILKIKPKNTVQTKKESKCK